jgi:hypothetical protein
MSDTQREVALAAVRQQRSQAAQRMISVTFQKEGIHCFPAAATDEKFRTEDCYDVSFLSHPHRHIFHFRVWISVWHNDREIEFIQFKRWCENLYRDELLQLDNLSCEMIADELFEAIAQRYPSREVWIEVAEDGENGCLIKYFA